MIKPLIRQLFYRSGFFRFLVGYASVLTKRTQPLGISHLLSYVGANAVGPIQRDEAVALFGIVRTVRPRTLVEFGFSNGHSAFNFLRALEPEAKLYSFDITDSAASLAGRAFSFDARFTFVHKSQAEFDPGDIDHRPVDFVFFDAAHELAPNIETFKRVLPCLTPGATIAVHDTGLWEKSHFSEVQEHFTRTMPGCWVTDTTYAHQPDERVFVDWIIASYPQFGALHFHSTHTLRHGFSLLQVRSSLSNHV